MPTETISGPVTLEQFLELERNAPENVRLELIRGEVREYSEEDPELTTRNARHAQATARFSFQFLKWLEGNPERPGTVADGEARCPLRTDPETITGLDVAYFEGEQHVNISNDQTYFDGPPVVAVEVLSPSDTLERLAERVRLLLEAGFRQVWLADPQFESVTVHRPDAEPVMYSASEELSGDPELPGFRCRVGKFFASARRPMENR